MQSAPSIDPQQVSGVGYFSTLASDGGETALEAAKTCVRQKAHTGDPLWPALEAQAKAGKKYDGAAHMTAAAALEKKGAPERAFSALATASYWAARAGKSWKPGWEAAKKLASRAGWSAAVTALDEVAAQGKG